MEPSLPLKSKLRPSWALILLALWLFSLVLGPLLLLLVYSLLKRGPYGILVWEFTLEQYLRVFDPLYLPIYFRSFKQALVASFSCLLLGFPTAYSLAKSYKFFKPFILPLLILPFLANFLVRAHSIRMLLSAEGPLSQGLYALGFITEPWSFNDSAFAVWLGMVTNYLPFMILPLYLSLDRFDFRLLDAARDLGARGLDIWTKILWPLTLPSILGGFTLVFIPLLAEFMIPDILGGGLKMQLGHLISDQFLRSRNWPFGAALSIMLLAVLALLFIAETLLKRPPHESP